MAFRVFAFSNSLKQATAISDLLAGMRLLVVCGAIVLVGVALCQAFGLDVRNDHGHRELDWWEGGVFYQIYPRSYKDTDGDGIGDIKGITENLDHLADLGVDGVWFSPLFRSPMADFGYDISDFRDVDPIFGTMEDLEGLIAKSKELGVKVILDFVPNHSSDEHEWFKKALEGDEKYREYYTWREGRVVDDVESPPTNWFAVFHTPAWTKLDGESEFYLHQFDAKQPDLNYENPAVKDEMDEMIKFWLDKGVDGFRIDAINHVYEDQGFYDEPVIDENLPLSYNNLDHIYTRDLEKNYEIIYSWRDIFDAYTRTDNHTRFMMTEAYTSLENLMKWFGQGNRRGSHMPFNFDFVSYIGRESHSEDYKRVIDQWIAAMPEYGSPNWVLGNHDRPRVASRFGRDRASGMAILEMLLPGIAVVYYGEEIGMEDNRDITFEATQDPQGVNAGPERFQEFTRDPVRTPFQWDSSENAGFSPADAANATWLPVHPNYLELNLAAQKAAPKSMFKLYKELIQLRKEHTFRHGDLKTFSLINNVFAFTRSLVDHKNYAVVVNINPNEVNVNLKHLSDDVTRATVVIASLDAELQKDAQIEDVANIVLGRYDAVVFEMDSGSAVIRMSIVLLLASVFRFFFV